MDLGIMASRGFKPKNGEIFNKSGHGTAIFNGFGKKIRVISDGIDVLRQMILVIARLTFKRDDPDGAIADPLRNQSTSRSDFN